MKKKEKNGAHRAHRTLGALALVLGILENLPAPAAGHAAGCKSRAFKPCHHVRRPALSGLPAALFIAAIKGLFARF